MKRILALLIVMALVICAMPVVAEASESTYDEYVVRFKEGYSPYDAAMLMSVADEGDVTTVIEDCNVYTVTADMLDSLDMSQVEYIEPNYRAVLLETYPNDPKYNSQKPYYSMTGMPKVWDMALVEPKYLAGNVKVAVIDSGIDTDHPDFANTTVYAYNYSAVDERGEVIVSTENVEEEQLHGTSVAGVIAAGFNDGVGIAGMTNATIYSLKVFGSTGAGYANICKAIKDAVDVYDCDVINMSLGFVSNTGEVIPDREISLLNDVIKNAADKGTIVVAAAGNHGEKDGTASDLPDGCRLNPIVYPAYCDNVISVAAVTSAKAQASFSSFNNKVDVAAPGVSLYLPRGRYKDTDQYYWRINGTSMASPQVAAAAAIMKSINPDANHDVMKSLIRQTAVDLGAVGRDDYYGYGLLDIYAMAKVLDSNTNKIYPSDPVYNDDKKEVKITYFNLDDDATSGYGARVAIYDKDNAFVGITEAQSIEANANEGCKLRFEGVEIPEGGHIRAFCMDWNKIRPVTESVPIYF